MGHTPAQRDKHALCGAKKKNGDKCRKFAGEGTDHRGIGRCKYHLGNTKAHRAHAVKQEAQRRANIAASRYFGDSFGAAIEVEPHEALLMMLYVSYGHAAWLSNVVKDGETPESDQHVYVQLFGDERDRVARIAKACLDAGVAERQVQVAEKYGYAIASLLRGLFGDPELALTAEQREVIPSLVRRHLTVMAADGQPALQAPAA